MALVGAFVMSVSLSASAADEAKFVKLVHVPTGKVLALVDDSEEAGARAALAKDEAKPERQWKLEKDGDFYKVVNRKSGKVLDVNENSKDEGGEIIQWDDKAEDNANQRWAWVGEGAERRLKSKDSGLVIEASAEDGKVVQKTLDEGAKAQLWKVVEVKE